MEISGQNHAAAVLRPRKDPNPYAAVPITLSRSFTRTHTHTSTHAYTEAASRSEYVASNNITIRKLRTARGVQWMAVVECKVLYIYSRGIYTEGLHKTTKILRRDRPSPGSRLEPGTSSQIRRCTTHSVANFVRILPVIPHIMSSFRNVSVTNKKKWNFIALMQNNYCPSIRHFFSCFSSHINRTAPYPKHGMPISPAVRHKLNNWPTETKASLGTSVVTDHKARSHSPEP